MYEEYWNLHSTPFDSNDGNRWYYESNAHEEAAARMHFLVERRRPCGILTGPSGTGKTTLLANIGDQLRRTQRHVALIDLYGMTGEDLLWQVVDCLHLAPPANLQPFLLWRRIRDHLHGQARAEHQTVILVDHCDAGDATCLAALAQLLRIGDETGRWLSLLIAANHTENLSRLTTWTDLRIDLSPINSHETAFYIHESLRRAGAEREVFEPPALDAVFAISGGTLRNINRVCELSLLAGMADRRTTIDAVTVIAAAENLTQTAQSAATTINTVIA